MKKITWAIIGEFLRRERSDVEVMVFFDRGYHPEANGRSYSTIVCPFCHCSNKAYRWSYIAVGKRCENCGAMFGWSGSAFRFKPKEIKMIKKHFWLCVHCNFKIKNSRHWRRDLKAHYKKHCDKGTKKFPSAADIKKFHFTKFVVVVHG